MNYFVYTRNEEVIKQLEALKCKRIKTLKDGTIVYTSPTDHTLNFEKKENTWCSNILVF